MLNSESWECSAYVELKLLSIKIFEIWKQYETDFLPFFIFKKLDILPEQISHQLHDTDFQESPYSQYSTVQFPAALQSPSLQSHFNTYSLDPQFSGGECRLASCELNKSTNVVAHNADDGYHGIKRSRLTISSMRIKGQEEFCVVCGDKASGYHYNALTCEGCKGKDKVKTKLKSKCALKSYEIWGMYEYS